MRDETAFAAVDFLVEASRSVKNLTVLFFGGEPMLRFDLIEKVVRYAANRTNAAGKTISWNMTTNGTLIDEPKAKWLAGHKVKYLLSMDGDKTDHDRYRKFPDGHSSFQLLAERLPMLKTYQPWQGVKMSITPESVTNLRSNIETLFALGINQFIYGYAHGLRWEDRDLATYERSLLDVCELWLEMRYRRRPFRITAYEESNLLRRMKPTEFGCGASRGRFCVDTCGDCYGCSKMCTILGPGKGVLPFGNVFQGFTRIRNRVTSFDGSIRARRKCASCEFRESCSGGCPAVNYAETGSIYQPDEVSCKVVLIANRVDAYMRRRQSEIFKTRFDRSGEENSCV
jgi:uncharacterized protein